MYCFVNVTLIYQQLILKLLHLIPRNLEQNFYSTFTKIAYSSVGMHTRVPPVGTEKRQTMEWDLGIVYYHSKTTTNTTSLVSTYGYCT